MNPTVRWERGMNAIRLREHTDLSWAEIGWAILDGEVPAYRLDYPQVRARLGQIGKYWYRRGTEWRRRLYLHNRGVR